MVEGEGKKEDQFGFTPEGEAIGYISLEQARVEAMAPLVRTPASSDRPGRMAFDVVEQEEGEDYYIITLSVRPEGDFAQGWFRGRAGQEQLFQ